MEISASVIAASELIPGKFFFVTLTSNAPAPRQTRSTRYFSTDEDFVYNNFFRDFGPHSLGTLFKYCKKVEGLLNESDRNVGDHGSRRTVHFTYISDGRRRVNAAFLAGGYAIVCGGRKLDEVIRALCPPGSPPLITYRDASMGPDLFPLKLEDALAALSKAHSLGFFSFSSFNVDEYDFFEKVENGDFNWILPGKFLAFCGPHHESKVDNSEYPVHAPEAYFRYFKQHGVTAIVRLNKKLYEADRFRSAGFKHYDLFFNDGSTPSDAILRQFLEICEREEGGIAVHCKAGLGRTGVLIGAYIVKHYRFSAAEAIAWLRICRPGSVIGWQQTWLEQKQSYLWLQGDLHSKTARQINQNNNKCFPKGIYHVEANSTRADLFFPSTMKEVARIASKLKMTKIESGGGEGKGGTLSTKDEERTQGDDLNRLKVRRSVVAKRASVMAASSAAAGKAKVWR